MLLTSIVKIQIAERPLESRLVLALRIASDLRCRPFRLQWPVHIDLWLPWGAANPARLRSAASCLADLSLPQRRRSRRLASAASLIIQLSEGHGWRLCAEVESDVKVIEEGGT
mmetsp:Transcript_46246/g.110031  ORF Transcript_46246/g.110031 Transcript_46246/m.110031 type:complete len:113 (+) Transcript_46246:62-400(+)